MITLSGIHAPNRRLTGRSSDTISAGGFRSVKLLAIDGCTHSIAEGQQCLDAGASQVVLRLPDSRTSSGGYPSYTDYASKATTFIRWWRSRVGCTLFQLDNEPNWMWAQPNYGPWQYQWWLHHVVPLIRKAVQPDVQLIAPPLSFSPGLWQHGPQNPTAFVLDEWLEAYAFDSAGTIPSVYQLFDYMGVNAYWQSEGQMHDPSYGRQDQTMHAKSGLPMVLTEYGNSCHEKRDTEGNPIYTYAQAEAIRADQYPRYLHDLAGSGYVQSAHVYLAPDSTPDWQGFQVGPALAKAMKKP